MWIYKIKAEKTEDGFYKIPKNCVNAEFYRFEEMLKSDERRLIKSAIVNWFSSINKGADFSVNFNGYDCIYLQGGGEMEEFYFFDYSIVDDCLVHHKNENEWRSIRKMVDRYKKIDKILSNL